MTLYVFFLIGDTTGIFSDPRLYAITKDKELADEFKNTRNMKFFRMKKEEVRKSEYKKYADKYKAYILGVRGYNTHSQLSLTNTSIIEIVSTAFEEEFVYTRVDYTASEMKKHTTEDAYAFNDDIMDALNDFFYYDFAERDTPTQDYFYSGITVPVTEDLKYWSVDMVSLFILFHGYTLK